MSTVRGRTILAVGAALVLAAACTSGDDTKSTGGTTGSTSPDSEVTGPSPGVTADSIKVGVTYVDTKALEKVNLNYNLGEHKKVYEALAADINDNGGINGRKLELVFAPIDPTSTQPAEAACVKLTEDDDVFLITGFFLNDAVLCPLEVHDTAVVGGGQTPERLERAKAPWVTWLPDSDQASTVTEAYAEAGELDGKVAVYGASRDEDEINNRIVPLLEDLGITPVEVGLNDAPADDVPANEAKTKTIAQRFKSSGADTVLLVGPSSQGWPATMADDTSYRPKLLFTDTTGLNAFATNAANPDTSVLEGALAGGGYGPDQPRFEEAEMQKCIAVLDKAGLDTPTPDEAGDDPSNQPYQAAFQACPDMALTKALLEASGKNLNYGTLQNAIDGLKVRIPGDPSERTYGPPPAGDGDPTAYLYAWNEATKELVLQEG